MRRLSSVQQSVQPDVCHAQEMLTVYPDAELRDFVGYKVLGWLLIGVAFVANGYVAFANIDVTPMRLLVSYWPIYLASLVALGLGMTLVSE